LSLGDRALAYGEARAATTASCVGTHTKLSVLLILPLLVLWLFGSISVAQTESDYFEHSELGGVGSTNYRVYYEVPKVFRTNRTEQVRIWMNVTQFSLTTAQVEARSIQVVLSVRERDFPGTEDRPQSLMPGQIWGPFTFEFHITDVEIGLGPSEAVDVTIKITIQAIEYMHPPIGDPIAYPKTFSNEKQIPSRMINPAEKPPPSSDWLSWLLQQLGISLWRLVTAVLAGGALSLTIRYTMPRQFLPLLLAVGSIFVLVGVLVSMYELAVFGAILIVTSVILYVFTHRNVFGV